MYFPYLRGKQEELLAVLEFKNGSQHVVPLFEPTSLSNANFNRYERIAKDGKRLGLIANSASGQPAPTVIDTMDMIDKLVQLLPEQIFPTYEIRSTTTQVELQAFSKRFRQYQCAIVHRNNLLSFQDLQNSLTPMDRPAVHILLEGGAPVPVFKEIDAVGRVLLRDGFDLHKPNRTYPRRTNFDDLLFTYRSLGFDGFGDFGITGDVYAPGGGAAKHVAIHLTERLGTPTIVANHFVSKTPAKTSDLKAKYFNALKQLINHTQSPPRIDFDTQGVREYHSSHLNRHFPGLGKLKRWSILHHLELMDSELQKLAYKSFV